MPAGFLETVMVLLLVAWLFGLSRILHTDTRSTWLVVVVTTIVIVLLFGAEQYRDR